MPKKLTIQEIILSRPSNSRLSPIEIVDGYFTYPNSKSEAGLKCICSCGKKTVVRIGHFKTAKQISCGCKKREDVIARNTKYKINHPKINQVFHSMMRRCYDVNHKQYKNYGGRGVKVCEAWFNNYPAFLEWSIGKWRAGYDLDKDTKGSGVLYSPDTCVFITKGENRAATRRAKKIMYNGKIMSKADICRANGIDATTVNSRIHRGWDFTKAVESELKINQYK